MKNRIEPEYATSIELESPSKSNLSKNPENIRLDGVNIFEFLI